MVVPPIARPPTAEEEDDDSHAEYSISLPATTRTEDVREPSSG